MNKGDETENMVIEAEESIYADKLPEMNEVVAQLICRINKIRSKMKEKQGEDPVEHCLARIKSEESMRDKCRRKGIPENTDSALNIIRDAIGIRIVCAFIDDVYEIRDYISTFEDCEIVEEKDYIKHAKSNGYRSYHMILKVKGMFYVEIQLRTISMDTWAALEHHLKYKKNISTDQELIVKELKRCADELASTDISMQTIRNVIYGDE